MRANRWNASPKIALASAALMFVQAQVVHASTLPYYDGFSYSPGALNGQTTPTGGATWTPDDSYNISITTGSLSYPDFPTTGNSLLFQSSSVPDTSLAGTDNTRVNLPSTISSGTAYYSMLINIAGGASSGGGVLAAFSPGGAGGGMGNYSAGLYMRQDPNNPAEFDLGTGVWNQRQTITWTTGYNYGTSVFVVGGLTFVSGSNNSDVSSLWVDPTLGLSSAPSPTVSISGANINLDDPGSGDDINSFGLVEGDDQPTSMGVDEIRVGTNFSDVDPAGTPTPEPATLGLLGVSGLMLLRRRARS